MLKALGMACLFLGCFFWGFNKSLLLKGRITALTELQKLLNLICGEIRCGHTPLPEAFLLSGRKVRAPFGRFASELGESLLKEEKKTFVDLWEEKLSLLGRTGLLSEDLDLIRELGGRIQSVDVGIQLEVLKFYEEMAGGRAKKAGEEYTVKARMYRYLGVLFGLFVVILLF